jgi:hypothetical protein
MLTYAGVCCRMLTYEVCFAAVIPACGCGCRILHSFLKYLRCVILLLMLLQKQKILKNQMTVLISLYVSSYCCMCPHTDSTLSAASAGAYYCCKRVRILLYTCVLILRYMCPHTDSTHCLRLPQVRHTTYPHTVYTCPHTDGTHHCGCCVPFFPPFVPFFCPQRALLSCISSLNQLEPPPTDNIPHPSTAAWSPRH